MDKLNINLKNSRESIRHVDHKAGNIFFSLNMDGLILAKQGSKTAISDIEMFENKNAINVESLELEFPYIEVPPKVETAYVKAKNTKIMESVRLISAGKSLLTGKEYHKLNISIPPEEWQKVESLFENFGKGGSGWKGWLTSEPVKVQKLLRLKPTNEHDDDIKQFEEAITMLETAKQR